MFARPRFNHLLTVLVTLGTALSLHHAQASGSNVDPCVLNSKKNLTPTFNLDPDGRTSQVIVTSDPDAFAFKYEIESSCQHIQAQVEALNDDVRPDSCAAYSDPYIDQSQGQYSFRWDPRRCLASATLFNFRHEVRLLLQAKESDSQKANATYHSYESTETTQLLKALDQSCSTAGNTASLAERAACWERQGHGLMDHAKAVSEKVLAGADVCQAVAGFSSAEKELVAQLAAHRSQGLKCDAKPADLAHCQSLDQGQTACLTHSLRALGEDWRAISRSAHTDPGPHYLTDRLAAIAAQAAKLSIFGRVCAAGLRFEAITLNTKQVAPKNDDETQTRCRLSDIRELQNMKPADWERWLATDLERLKHEPDPFEKSYAIRLTSVKKPKTERPKEKNQTVATTPPCAIPGQKDPTGMGNVMGPISSLMMVQVDTSQPAGGDETASEDPVVGSKTPTPAPKPTSSKIPPKPTVKAARAKADIQNQTDAPSSNNPSDDTGDDLALMHRLGFKTPKAIDPKTPAKETPSGPAKTRSVQELVLEADTPLKAFDPQGKPFDGKTAGLWIEEETEQKINKGQGPTEARYYGWQESAAEAMNDAKERVAALPKDADYQAKVRAVLEALYADYLKFYSSNHGDVTDYFENGYANLSAQTKFTLMTLGELGLLSDPKSKGPRRKTERVLVYRTNEGGEPQLHILVFNPATREVWDPLTNVRTIGTELKPSEPELSLLDYVKSQQGRSKVQPSIAEAALLVPGTEPPPPPPPAPKEIAPVAETPAELTEPKAIAAQPDSAPLKPLTSQELAWEQLYATTGMTPKYIDDMLKNHKTPAEIKATKEAEEKKRAEAMKQAIALAESQHGRQAIEEAMKQLPEALKKIPKEKREGFDLFKALKLIGQLPKGIPIGKILGMLVTHPELLGHAAELLKYMPELAALGVKAAGAGLASAAQGKSPVIGEVALPKIDEVNSKGLLAKLAGGIGDIGKGLAEGIENIGKGIGDLSKGIGNGISSAFSGGGSHAPMPPPPPIQKEKMWVYEDKPGLSLTALLAGIADPELIEKLATDGDRQLGNGGHGTWVSFSRNNWNGDWLAHASGKNVLEKGPPRDSGQGLIIEFADPKDRKEFSDLQTESEREKKILSLKLRDIQRELGSLPTEEVSAMFDDPVVAARRGSLPAQRDDYDTIKRMKDEIDEIKLIAPKEYPHWLADTVQKLPRLKRLLDSAKDFRDKTWDHPEEWQSWIKMMGKKGDSQGISIKRAEGLIDSISDLEQRILSLRSTITGDEKTATEPKLFKDAVLEGLRLDDTTLWRKMRLNQEPRSFVKPRVGISDQNADPKSNAQLEAAPGAPEIFGTPSWGGNMPARPELTLEGPKTLAQPYKKPSPLRLGQNERAPVSVKKKIEGELDQQIRNENFKPRFGFDERIWPADFLQDYITNGTLRRQAAEGWSDTKAAAPAIATLGSKWEKWAASRATPEAVMAFAHTALRPSDPTAAAVVYNYRKIADSRPKPDDAVIYTGPDGKPVPADVANTLRQAFTDFLSNSDYTTPSYASADGKVHVNLTSGAWFYRGLEHVPGFPPPPGDKDEKAQKEYLDWARKYYADLSMELSDGIRQSDIAIPGDWIQSQPCTNGHDCTPGYADILEWRDTELSGSDLGGFRQKIDDLARRLFWDEAPHSPSPGANP